MATNIYFKIKGKQIILKNETKNEILKPVEEIQETIELKGTVNDKSGEPLPGVSILIQGTTVGTETNFDGEYILEVSEGDVLVFSFIGMKTTQIIVKNVTTIDVVLEDDTAALDEVVVTALGISRDKKGLGYAVQELQGDDITQFYALSSFQLRHFFLLHFPCLLSCVCALQSNELRRRVGVPPESGIRQ